MNYYNNNADDVVRELATDADKGLNEKEVEKRREQYGANRLREAKKKTVLMRFLEQFKDVMIIILLIAAVISFVIACTTGEIKEFFEPLLIVLIVIINAVMGVVQESKAEKALDALQGLSAPHARVVRDGKESIIDNEALVPGDIIVLEAGDYVPADARLLRSASLKSEESALTGESVASEKDASCVVADKAALGDRVNMVYSGCSITYGSARAVVVATGMATEMGKIAGLLESEKEEQTPLQKKLAQLGKYLGIMAIAACAIIFVIGLISSIPVLEIFMTSVSLAVSAIPEGLPAIVTIVLSIGVQRMAKKNAIIRRLSAVETLGSASIICSDKTGTLTQNRMTLVKAFLADDARYEEISADNSEEIRRLLAYGTLCCNGSVEIGADGAEKHLGDPTETSIVFASQKNGNPKDKLFANYPRLAEIPFDSDRKLMSVIVDMDGKNVVIVKGAYDMLAVRCTRGNIGAATVATEKMSSEALRVLGVAYKEIGEIPADLSPENIEKDLTLIGLVGMIDPPRPEAKAAVEVCKSAGIKPVMITGDHVVTASAIARQLGILEEGGIAITGEQLDAMTDVEFDSRIADISVYARVSPENKIRIVKAWQRRGQVVSMTGDGVNDAPALKAADIGCAMGITGTDVAKGASDMTLTDDNFATIVDAVREGRGIYANIKKVVGYLLGTNFGEIILVFIAMLIWRTSPLLSMQLLWINLVTDSLPAIALGMEAIDGDIMNRKPRPKKEGLFANGYGVRIVLQGMMFGVLSLGAYALGSAMYGADCGMTMAFIVLSLSQVVQAYNMRSDRSLFKIGFFTNRTLNLAALAAVLLVLFVLFTPGVMTVFGLILMPAKMYLIALAFVVAPLVIIEFAKLVGLIK